MKNRWFHQKDVNGDKHFIIALFQLRNESFQQASYD